MKDKNSLSLLFFCSSVSSSILVFVLPYMVHEHTESALLTSLQVAFLALGSLFACYFVKNTNYFNSDKKNILFNELCLVLLISSLLIIFPFSFIEDFLSASRSGYTESLIGSIASKSEESSRKNLIGYIKVYSNIGSILGFSISAPITTLISVKATFFISLLLIICSFISLYSLNDEGV